MFIKLGESFELTSASIQQAESILSDEAINENFKKFAGELKRIAPKANDFLYFSCVMMTAAEAVLVNPDGTLKLTKAGKPLEAGFEIKGDSWSWKSNDPSIMPVKNSNGDIFPELELLKAYKNWVGKPLCVDHKSSSVDAIRGVILDTYYDRALKRVIALCALDKVSYPELARKVSTGYSTSVSMGTAVGRAICSDCGKSARTEHEFCSHMRSKSCYGEINIDLQPIELSIVVNGADPNAKIRTILAAANNLNRYVESKEIEINKLSSLNSDEIKNKIKDLEEDLKKASSSLSDLKLSLDTVSEDENNLAPYGQSSGIYTDPGLEFTGQNTLNLPERLASSDDIISEFRVLKESFGEKFENFEKKLENLSNKLHTINEEIMSDTKGKQMNKEAYFQGGGGVNEPTPGEVKYPKDPLNEASRSKDKHMNGQSPFPEVGDVDGMHPSPESVDTKSELERKKMLLRAEVEERAMRRTAALEKAKENIARSKEAYFQGGGGLNEPTPGKVKYPKDPLNEKLREKEDKQMVGQKPFPDVGDVEGLHPSPASADEKDELKRKQLLRRAFDLKARFVKASDGSGNEDLGKSAWHVFIDDKLALTASVDEISGGRSEVLYDTIATKEFGTKMLAKIRSVGFEKAASIYKAAQAEQSAMPAAPADAGGAAPVPPMADPTAAPAEDAAPEAPAEGDKDMGGKGDKKEAVLDTMTDVKGRVSDLDELVKELVGEQPEMGSLEEMGKKSSFAPLYSMRKSLNAALLNDAKKAVAELKEHEAELSLIATVLDDSAAVNSAEVESVIDEAVKDSKEALANSLEIMSAFVQYAHGTDGLLKMSQDLTESKADDVDDVNDAADMLLVEDANDADLLGDANKLDAEIEAALADDGDTMMANDENDVMMDVPADKLNAIAPHGLAPVSASTECDLTTKEGRATYRAKLAAQSVEFSDMLDQAHKLTESTHLDTKPSDNLGHVETIEEAHKIDLEVAQQATPKVRKEAERLNQLITEGKVKAEDVDSLIAQGVDPATVKYWKEMWGEAGKEGSEFAKLLTTETLNTKVAEEVSTYKVKIARAYELCNEMVRRGIVASDKSAITAQVEEIMTWNDEGFNSMKRVVAKHELKKTASLPSVGQIGSGDVVSSDPAELDLQGELERAFSGRRH